jgi:hypothetical protein
VGLVQARGGAQLCVLQDGRLILDEAIGCPPDALFLIFSVGKAGVRRPGQGFQLGAPALPGARPPGQPVSRAVRRSAG